MCRVFNCWWVFLPLLIFARSSFFPGPPPNSCDAPMSQHTSLYTLYSIMPLSYPTSNVQGRELNLLIIGVEKGYYQFTSHLIAELIRVVSKGSAPGNNLLMDTLYSIIALVSLFQSAQSFPITYAASAQPSNTRVLSSCCSLLLWQLPASLPRPSIATLADV